MGFFGPDKLLSCHITEQIWPFVNMSHVAFKEPEFAFFDGVLYCAEFNIYRIWQQLVLQLINEPSNRHDNVYKSTSCCSLLSGRAGFPHLTADLTSIRSIGEKTF